MKQKETVGMIDRIDRKYVKGFRPNFFNFSKKIFIFLKTISSAGGYGLLVGGFVRNMIMNLEQENVDIDIEVFGIPPKELFDIVQKTIGQPKIVGRGFEVIKVDNVDISLPRFGKKESQTSFWEGNPNISIETAAKRRDFTINSIYYDPLNGQLIDFFDGISDIKSGILRHTDNDTFKDDILRIIRGIQFSARFNMKMNTDTITLCKTLVERLHSLPRERIFEELKKALLKGKDFIYAFSLADQIGIYETIWPELSLLTKSKDQWHNNLKALNEAVNLKTGDKFNDSILMFSILCHNINSNSSLNTRIETHSTINMEKEQLQKKYMLNESLEKSISKNYFYVEPFLSKWTQESKFTNQVKNYVKFCKTPEFLYSDVNNADLYSSIRRLSLQIDIKLLVSISRAIYLSNNPKEKFFPAGDFLLEIAHKLGVLYESPKSFIKGKDLIEMGLSSGKEMGEKLDHLFEMQLDGLFCSKDSAMDFLKSYIKNK